MEMQPESSEPFMEVATHVQPEGVVGDEHAQLVKGICHLLEIPAVICDGEITLREVPKLGLV